MHSRVQATSPGGGVLPSPVPGDRDKIFIKDLMVQAILGVNRKERVKRQNININIVIFHDIRHAAMLDDVRGTINYSVVCRSVVAYTEDSHHYTLESLCSGIARLCCLRHGADEVVVHVEKPCALSLARCPAVEVHRTRDFFLVEEPRLLERHQQQQQQQQEKEAMKKEESETRETKEESERQPCARNGGADGGAPEAAAPMAETGQPGSPPAVRTAFLALGSNLGQREVNIYRALNMLAQSQCEVICTSALYQVRAHTLMLAPRRRRNVLADRHSSRDDDALV